MGKDQYLATTEDALNVLSLYAKKKKKQQVNPSNADKVEAGFAQAKTQKKIKCYYCDEVRHKVRDCPKKASDKAEHGEQTREGGKR